MKNFLLVAIGFIFLLGGLFDKAYSQEVKKTKSTKHFNESLFDITGKGEFSVEILLDEKEYKIGKNVIGLVIHNRRDEDVEGAGILIMLTDEKGRNIGGSPVVTEKGSGLYTVAGLDLGKEGRMELKIEIKKKTVIDSALFVFPEVVKKKLPAGQYTE